MCRDQNCQVLRRLQRMSIEHETVTFFLELSKQLHLFFRLQTQPNESIVIITRFVVVTAHIAGLCYTEQHNTESERGKQRREEKQSADCHCEGRNLD